MAKVAMLERAGKERFDAQFAGLALERLAFGTEPDDDHPGVKQAHRLEEHVDALLRDELSEVDDSRPLAREERSEP